MNDFSFENIYIVTGASSGIGQAVALHLNALGAKVIGIARDETRLQQIKAQAQSPDNFIIEVKDLGQNIEDLPNYVKALREQHGKLAGVVHCAGMDLPKALQILALDDGHKIFDINYFSPIMLTKGIADRRNNIGQGTSIVFIASSAAVYPDRGQSFYAASKSALITSAKAISKELSPRGIRCNCISPAYVETPMYLKNKETIGTDDENYPLGIGKPADIAHMVAHLLSDKGKWITGQNYIMDGGRF